MITKSDNGKTTDKSSIITVNSLVKDYGDVRALNGIDLVVNDGELFALLGPNGAGKTTLFSILSTLKSATSGEATVLDYDVKTQRAAVRSEIGIVFQEPALDDRLSARDNLRLMALFYGIGWKEAKERTEEVIEVLEIRDFVNRPPKKLSGGQKRKLELARSLISDPKLLFLDEATLGLDVDARRNFWNTIQQLTHEGRTVFFTTHYMEEAEVADRIALISEGDIIAVDTPQNLKNSIGGGLIRLDTESNTEALHWLEEQGHTAKTGEREIFVVAENPATVLPGILKSMPQKVLRAEIREPSLEDVFLTLTGKGLDGSENRLNQQAGRSGGGS